MKFLSFLRKFVPAILYIGWVPFVIIAFYWFHPPYLACEEWNIPFCLEHYGLSNMIRSMLTTERAMYFYSLLVLYIAWALWRNSKKIAVTLRPVWVIVWFFLFAILSLTLHLLYPPSLVNIGNALFFTELSIITKVSLLTVVFTTMLWAGAAIGSTILNKYALKVRHAGPVPMLETFFLSVGTGWIALSFVLFILAAIGQFAVVPTVAAIALLAVVCRHEFKHWLHVCLTHRFTISFDTISLEAVAFIGIHTIIGYCMLDGIIPLPMNWDGMYRYINTVHLVSTSGHFITGVFPYPFELLLAVGPVVFRSMMAGIALSWFAGWMMTGVFYVCCRRVLPRNISALVTFGLISLPPVFYLLALDTKVDFFAVFYCLLSLLAAMQWYAHRENRWLIFSGILLGMAFTGKFTAIFYVLGFCAMILYILRWRMNLTPKKLLSHLLLFFAAVALPLVPWVAKNIIEAGSVASFHAFTQGGYQGPDMGECGLNEEAHYLTFSQRPSSVEHYVPTGHYEEIVRYFGYEPRTLMSYLSLPWRVTLNTQIGVNHPLNQVGPLLLVLLPLLVLFKRAEPEVDGRPMHVWTAPLVVLTLVGYVAWMFLAHGISWYALPIYAVYLVMVTLVWTRHVTGRVLWAIIVGGYLACILVNFYFRVVTPTPEWKYQYVSGFLDDQEVINAQPPRLQEFADIINNDVPTPTEPKYVYNVGTYIIYRVKENDVRIYNDHLMDTLNCLFIKHQDDDDAVLDELIAKGFKYFTFNPDVQSIDQTPEHSLIRKMRRMAIFLNKMLIKKRMEAIMYTEYQQLKHEAMRILK